MTTKTLPKNDNPSQKAAALPSAESQHAEPAETELVLRSTIQAELEATLEAFQARCRDAFGLQPEPERVFAAMLEERILRRASSPDGGYFGDVSWKTPVGDLLLALTTGPLTEDGAESPDAWEQFGEKALHNFADELDLICKAQIEEGVGNGAWDVVNRLSMRMRAAAVVHRKLFEARFATSPHWGGQTSAQLAAAESAVSQ